MKDFISFVMANRAMALALAAVLVLLGYFVSLFLPVHLVINGALKLVQAMERNTAG